jgi:hypothetical protein
LAFKSIMPGSSLVSALETQLLEARSGRVERVELEDIDWTRTQPASHEQSSNQELHASTVSLRDNEPPTRAVTWSRT